MDKDFKQVLNEINDESIEKTAEIGHVSYYLIEKTPYSFHFYATYKNEKTNKVVLSEVLYDLRNKQFFIKRNGKEVKFNIDNLDTVIPRSLDGGCRSNVFYSRKSTEEFFDMVSVEENKGMYQAMINVIGAIGDERADMSSRALIRLITDYNKLELLYKAGIDISAAGQDSFRSLVYAAGQNDVKKVHEIFGLTKSQFKFMNEFAGIRLAIDHRYRMKYLGQKEMDLYRGYLKSIEELEIKYNLDGRLHAFNRAASLSDYLYALETKNGNRYYGRDFFDFIMEYDFPNPQKLIEYLLFECFVSQGLDFQYALSDYSDYYRMCKELEYERFEKYPKYLRTYHDVVSRNYNEVRDEVANRNFAKATEKYLDLETSVDDYILLVPRQSKDLVNEGNVLQHCVGSYIKKVANGQSQIMFLRSKKFKEDPLVTVEIRENEIVQVRGQANRLPTKEEKTAILKFAKKKSLEFKSVV